MSSDAVQLDSQNSETGGSQAGDGRYQTAHILFLDVVGYTKLRPAKQKLVLLQLQDMVRGIDDFRAAREKDQLIALPTGDGMALVFLNTLDGSGSATSCAEKIAEAAAGHNEKVLDEDLKLKVRMGIHSGNIVHFSDINGSPNVAGEGINTAQRVMDCGDRGHILLSDHCFHLLPAEPDRTDFCIELGKVRVKHDQEITLHSLSHDQIGNPDTPQKVRLQNEQRLEIENARAEVRRAHKRRKISWVVALGLVVIMAGVVLWATRKPPSLAVLRFSSGTQSRSSRAVSKGVTEQFYRSFSYLTDIKTLPLNKSIDDNQNPSNQSEDERIRKVVEAAKNLGVRYVLTGTAESDNDDANLANPAEVTHGFTVDLQVELIDTESYTRVWHEEQKLPFAQLRGFQDHVITEVARKMGMNVVYKIDQREVYAKQASAHWWYMLGRFYSTERPKAEGDKQKNEDLGKKAIASYEKAIEIDPGYALAYAGLADAYTSIIGSSLHPAKAKNLAISATRNAQANGERLAEVYASIGAAKWWLEGDFSNAKVAFLLSIELNGEFSDSRKRYSSFLAAQGEAEKAEEQILKALTMEPDSSIMHLTRGMNLYFGRNYDLAEKELRDLVKRAPMAAAYRFLAFTLEQQGVYAGALEALKQSGEADSDYLGAQGHIEARFGNSAEARRIALMLKKLKEESETEDKNYVSPYNIAVIYAELPTEEAEAFRLLDIAIGEFDPRVHWLKVDPRFDKLRKSNQTEFNKRLVAAGLPPN